MRKVWLLRSKGKDRESRRCKPRETLSVQTGSERRDFGESQERKSEGGRKGRGVSGSQKKNDNGEI